MRKLSKNIIIYVLIFVVIVTMALVFSTATKEPIKEVSLSKITNELASRNVSKLNVDNNKMRMTATLKGSGEKIQANYTASDYMLLDQKYILPQMEDGKLTVSPVPPKETPWYISILPTAIMVIVLISRRSAYRGSARARRGAPAGTAARTARASPWRSPRSASASACARP